MRKRSYHVTGKVEMFPMKAAWFYVRIPKKYSELAKSVPSGRRFVPITVTLGSTTWDTSLLPFGGGSGAFGGGGHFIALKKSVRKAEKINVGDIVSLTFHLRRP